MIKIVLLDIDGVITNGELIIDATGKESKKINYKDIDAIFELKKRYKIGFITGENTEIALWFKKRFLPDFFYSGIKNKVEVVKEIISKTNVNINNVCYIGDSLSDLESIKYVGVGFCPSNSCYEVKKNSNVCLSSEGGNGVVNELLQYLKNEDIGKYQFIDELLLSHVNIFKLMLSDYKIKDDIIRSCEVMLESFKHNKKLMICGNGGSAADSQHIATEFVSKFYKERKAINAEALTVNTSSLTAIANDYKFDCIFERQIEAKAVAGDVLIGISTSGKSSNVILANIEGFNSLL